MPVNDLKNFSFDFVEKMKNRVRVSHHKYGDLEKTKQDPTIHRDELRNAEKRIKDYKETGNTEYLIDAANFLMFEFMEMHGAFIPTDNNERAFIVQS
jgi:hypothetical protein